MTDIEKKIRKMIHDRIKQKDFSAEIILYGFYCF
jgi:hypothetical protein